MIEGKRPRRWWNIPEAGSRWGILFVYHLARLGGRTAARWFLVPLALYFVLRHARLRRHCAEFLRRVDQRPTFARIYTQVLRFAQVSLDRMFLLSGKKSGLEFQVQGHEYLVEARKQGKGALLFGAHLGSFEALRALSVDRETSVYVLAHFSNAEHINSILDNAGHNRSVHFIPYHPGKLDHILSIQAHIAQGDLVALLADRQIGGSVLEIPFLNDPAPFPTGPFELAALLQCPVFLTLGLHEAPNRYHLLCEPLTERVKGHRRRVESLRPYIEHYARRLEHYVRKHPDNWFNFFDFWHERSQH